MGFQPGESTMVGLVLWEDGAVSQAMPKEVISKARLSYDELIWCLCCRYKCLRDHLCEHTSSGTEPLKRTDKWLSTHVWDQSRWTACVIQRLYNVIHAMHPSLRPSKVDSTVVLQLHGNLAVVVKVLLCSEACHTLMNYFLNKLSALDKPVLEVNFR